MSDRGRALIPVLADRLVARSGGRVRAFVPFLASPGEGHRWTRTDLRRTTAAIPGVLSVEDEAGRTAALFGLETSGHALLYDGGGVLRFSGGIKPARGHEGDSAGRTTLLALLSGAGPAQDRTPVHGRTLGTFPAHREGAPGP